MPHNRLSHSFRMPLSPPFIVGYEWVRDDVLNYYSSIMFSVGVGALSRQLELAKLDDSLKMIV